MLAHRCFTSQDLTASENLKLDRKIDQRIMRPLLMASPRYSRTFSIALLVVSLGVAHYATAEVNLSTLVTELSDRDSLAVHPNNAYTQQQASSHDTRNAEGYSRLGAPWGFANADFGNYLRQETIDGREEWVLMDDQGPGVITRWWATGISQELLDDNRIRIYIDGATTPTVEATAEQLVGGDNMGFGPGLNFETPEKGGNLYGPLPYQKRVLITWDGPTTHGDAHVALRDPSLKNSIESALWYNINYRKLPKGAEVDSYDSSDLSAHQTALDRVNEVLSNPAATGSIELRHKASQELAHGQSIAHSIASAGAIRRVRVSVSGEDQLAALSKVHLVLAFDGQETARVPVGEFFGNGLCDSADNPYNEGGDYMRSVAADGSMTSFWVMPFAQTAKVRLENQSGQAVQADLEVDSGEWTWSDDSMHFHADYIFEEKIRTRTAEGGPWPGDAGKRELYSHEGDADFRFLTVRGRGVFVGDTMSIRNKTTGAGLNSWWGEGDEKIYVDYVNEQGEYAKATPDHVGTGTEDYYGYSFGSGKEFTSPFVTQPNAAGNRADNGALTVNGRVRGLDAIPFDHSFKFDMEVWKWKQGMLDIGAATFWYGVPGAKSLRIVADLAGDLSETDNFDTAGDGSWSYYASDQSNPSAPEAKLAPLEWGPVGELVSNGFGGGQNGSANLPAISTGSLFETGRDQNLGIHGDPGNYEIAVHAGGDDFNDSDADQPYLVARWKAGPSSTGMINISGSVRNFVAGNDSVDFYIYVDGQLAFEAHGSSDDGKLPETYFELDKKLQVGEYVDFVVGNGGDGNLFDDETILKALIRAPK